MRNKSAIAFGALTAGTASVLRQSIKFERFKIQFATLTQSMELSKKTMKELIEFTEKTPFSFDQVATAARVLLSFQIPVEEVGDKLQVLGDIAASRSINFRDLALIFGKVDRT